MDEKQRMFLNAKMVRISIGIAISKRRVGVVDFPEECVPLILELIASRTEGGFLNIVEISPEGPIEIEATVFREIDEAGNWVDQPSDPC